MFGRHERQKPKPVSPFTMDIDGIKCLIRAKLGSLISKDVCKFINKADIYKDKVGNKDYYITFDNITISEISELKQQDGQYQVVGCLKADFKNEDGGIIPEISRLFSADLLIEENENHEAEIKKLIKIELFPVGNFYKLSKNRDVWKI